MWLVLRNSHSETFCVLQTTDCVIAIIRIAGSNFDQNSVVRKLQNLQALLIPKAPDQLEPLRVTCLINPSHASSTRARLSQSITRIRLCRS